MLIGCAYKGLRSMLPIKEKSKEVKIFSKKLTPPSLIVFQA